MSRDSTMRKRPVGKAGFTLMEVLVAAFILGTAVVILVQGLTAGIRLSARAQRITEAALAADEIFQRMDSGEIDFTSQSEGSLEDLGGDQAASRDGGGEDRSIFRWFAEVESRDDDLYEVALKVTWDDSGRDSRRAFESSRLFYLPSRKEIETE